MSSHIIFGAGLIGGFLGGIFTSLGQDTRLVCRPQTQKKLANGLRLTDYHKNEVNIPKLYFIDSEIPPATDNNMHCRFLWITVKCTAIQKVSNDIKPFVGPNTIILCCQNGLGSEQIIKEHFPNNQILRVMVPFNVAEPAPGHLHRGSEGTLHIETSVEQPEVITELVEVLDSKMLPVKETKAMLELQWAKLQLNLGNSVNALADIPVKNMLQQRGYRLVIAALMKELLKVTDSLEIQLPKLTSLPARYLPLILSLPNFLFNLVANKMLAIDPTVRTSMWWDLSQGKNTEIDYLNGAIIKAAQKHEIACPANTRIIQLIKESEIANASSLPRKRIEATTLLKEIA
ncbi:2-dehydropantoate 2-reductase [Aquimarina spongiae]|uniref:2-dehydropantoate 2-reductase n=1 Tax=Aquimarina spongiae TaxID=570521 RepID=A0A1M6AJ26_9FLAO|nr:2-dehydropantoate 2-reductase [Aquimarina spongiae]SHI36472.1 ketopantoate reductase [Aquimarina spongiae]